MPMSTQPLKLHNGKTNIIDELKTELLGLARLYIDVYSIDAVCETMRDYHEPHVFGLFERRSVLKRMPDDVVIILFFAELHPSLREPLDLDADDLVEISLLFDIDMIEVMDTWTFEDVIRLNRELRTPAQMVPCVLLGTMPSNGCSIDRKVSLHVGWKISELPSVELCCNWDFGSS